MKSKLTDYYPPSPGLKREMYPYGSVDKLKEDIDHLYSAACRLKLLSDEKSSDIETELFDHFRCAELMEKLGLDEDDPFAPDALDSLYPALADDRKEEFLFIMRGLIQEKLSF
jgi:ribosome assembly protein YihI (activator of Der GTPase)